MRAPLIEVRDLYVRAGEGETVRGVSFTLSRGEVYAVLEAVAGSGATTLLEAVAGLRRPVSGTVRVGGADPYEHRDAVRSGAVWREGGLFPGLTVAEVVDAWRRWTLDPLTRDEALALTGLAGLADVRFERLGPGERRLLDVALALVARSDVLYLDGPTAGLGGADAARVWDVLRLIAAHGTAVLVATGDPAEAARADRVGVLARGRLAGRLAGPAAA
ncbi:ATP-binding cassette domain-containing protein [Actinomadura parmotrematis]|uniref:ATP-binding cassette domain-containing protein n=1 Tax=Actinomadura parmotrematis TaxID=2864039 RepID=A0ABS7FX71_9ACTN|nr:ATP-binding cassette domain-containing protein [Actinomadura parmotrematis]MBW8484886.1 ATP-binding cassette domain-containing protein [Actinomadura parmotrematis]